MAHSSSLVFAGIAPHPPIMVPEVGRENIAEVRSSIDAMAVLTERVIRSGAQTIVLISPHAPLDARAFVAYDGPELYGDFAMFRAHAGAVQTRLDDELLTAITQAAAEENLLTIKIKGYELDHGTTVPLYFMQRNGWSGRVVALGYSFVSNEDHIRFGRCIRRAIDKMAYAVAFIASGDLSHRLKLDAPAGYNPDAHLFDEEVVDAIRTCSTMRIVNIDQELRRAAGECGYRSMLVALGVAEGLAPKCEVISYEAPFGVGYLVAQLVSEPRAVLSSPFGRGWVRVPSIATGSSDESDMRSARSASGTEPLAVASGSRDTSPGSAHISRETLATGVQSTDFSRALLPTLARLTIETFITTGTVIPAPDNLPDDFCARAGCFVCIKTIEGDLRGCIGTIEPVKDTLAEELIANAISAATRDPRFSPVRKDELPSLSYSVDVLSAPEPTTPDHLDPLIYGVIVEDESGSRRGLLLPNLEGIETAAHQVEIASRKAGIAPGSNVKLFRFRAERYSE